MPRRMTVRESVTWPAFFKAKTTGYGMYAAAIVMGALAFVGLLFCVRCIATVFLFPKAPGGVVFLAGFVAIIALIVGRSGIRVVTAANKVVQVKPITARNVHLLPDSDTLVRGAAMPELALQHELLRSAAESDEPKELLLRAADTSGDCTDG